MNKERREFIKKTGWTLLGSGVYAAVFHLLPSGANASTTLSTRNLYAFIVDTHKCIGCGKCVAACKEENCVPDHFFRTWVERYTIMKDGEVQVDSPQGALNGFQPLAVAPGNISKSFFVPKLCNHCKNPNCVQVCPVGATYVTREGFVLVDEKQCVGCSYCAQACPYSARFINPVTHTADKCTWCYHRIVKGYTTACVTVCPTGARQFGKIYDPDSPVYKTFNEGRLLALKPETGNNPMTLYLGLTKEVL